MIERTGAQFDLGPILSPLPDPYAQLRLDGAFIYTADPARPVIPNGSLLIRGSTITAVGTRAEVDAIEGSLAPANGRTRRIDAAGKMVLPGFVNNHWHEASAVLVSGTTKLDPDDSDTRALDTTDGANILLTASAFNQLLDVGNALPDDIAYLFAVRSYLIQLRTGTTCAADFGSVNRPELLARALLATGIRGTVSTQAIDGECRANENAFTRTRDTDSILAQTQAVLERYKDDATGRLRAMPTALWQINASDELLQGTAALAEKYGTPWGSHLAASENESDVTRRYFGVRAVERLYRLGVLSPRLISAHTSYADDDEFGWIINAGVQLTYSPQKYGATGETSITRTGQIVRFIKANAPVTLSSDGDPVPVGYMPESMRMGWLACNDCAEDPSVMTPMRALSMSTRLGAESLGWSSAIGSLTAGKKADFVIVPIDDWRYEGVRRPLSSFLIVGGSTDIDTVVVDGRILIEGRSSTFIDEKALSAAFLRASQQVAETFSA